ALAAAFSFALVAAETLRFFLAGPAGVAAAFAAGGLPRRRAAAPSPSKDTILTSCARWADNSPIWSSILAIAMRIRSAGSPLPDFLGMFYSPWFRFLIPFGVTSSSCRTVNPDQMLQDIKITLQFQIRDETSEVLSTHIVNYHKRKNQYNK